jgi:hypothetical protein
MVLYVLVDSSSRQVCWSHAVDADCDVLHQCAARERSALTAPSLRHFERRATVALGKNANMEARIAADHIAHRQSLSFNGALGNLTVCVRQGDA